MTLRIALLACVLVIATHGLAQAQDVGSGPLTLSPGVADAYERFRSLPDPLFFAVTKDGRSAGWSYCQSLPCAPWKGRIRAVRSCERASGGRACYIFANMNGVVWKGKVTIEEWGADPLSKTAPPIPPEGPSQPVTLVKCRLLDGFVISMVPERCKSVGGIPE
jgi:hypothetical protein